MARTPLTGILLLVLTGCGPAPASEDGVDPEVAEVLSAAQGVFALLASRDTAALRALMLPSGTFVSVADGAVRVSGLEQIAANLSGGGPRLLERMWDPEVRIDGGIATVWTPYDFHRDGEFSHCGIDAFQLVKTEDAGWRVASVIYTVQREGCPPGPLGPPTD